MSQPHTLNLTESVYRAMRADLLACRIRPGERLRIPLLCERYGSSSGAVREALAKLSAEGLVLAEPNRGYAAASISAAELLDQTIARVEIETTCLRMAISGGDLSWEERLLGAAYRLSKTPLRETSDPLRLADSWSQAHSAFHEALVAACPSKALLNVRRQLYEQTERYRRLSIPLNELNRDLDQEHQQLARAALDRDKEKATAIMKDHLEKTTEILLQSVRETQMVA